MRPYHTDMREGKKSSVAVAVNGGHVRPHSDLRAKLRVHVGGDDEHGHVRRLVLRVTSSRLIPRDVFPTPNFLSVYKPLVSAEAAAARS